MIGPSAGDRSLRFDGGTVAGLSEGVRTTLARATIRWPAIAIGLAILLSPLVGRVPETVAYLPFLLSVVLFGLPHGAVDHLVPYRLAEMGLWRSIGVVFVIYGLLGGLYALAWTVDPVVSLAGFILLTWYHWGQGDVYALVGFVRSEYLGNRIDRWLAIAVRGGLPMLVPLLSHPEEYRRVAVAIVELFDPAAVDRLATVFDPDVRLAIGVGFVAIAALSLALGWVRVRSGAGTIEALRWDAFEVGLLFVYFWLLPPIFAIGLYFALWHAVRHIGRLSSIDERSLSALSAGSIGYPTRRFAIDAAPLTAASLAIFAVLFVGVSAGVDLDSLLAVYLVGIAVLTLPHVAVVAWMDRRQLGMRP